MGVLFVADDTVEVYLAILVNMATTLAAEAEGSLLF